MGLTIRYGILIRDHCFTSRRIVAHELTHTRQYKQRGGIEQFLRQYLAECLLPPYYPNGALNREAEETGEKLTPQTVAVSD